MFKKMLSLAVFTCILSLSVFAKDIQKVELNAKIKSNNCKNKIENTLNKTNGVIKVNANVENKSVKIEYDKDIISETQLIKTINDLDAKFEAKSIDSAVKFDYRLCDRPCKAVLGGKKECNGCRIKKK